MKLLRLKCKDLFCFESVDIDFTKYKPGIILIEGSKDNNFDKSNGSGKSSVFELINWIMFDDTIKGDMSKNKNKIIRIGCAKGIGLLTIQIGTEEISIKKSRSKEGTAINITVNGVPRAIKNPTAGKLFIEQMLGIDFTAWKNSIVLGQNASSLFVEGGSKSKSDLIGSILNFEVIDQCLEYVKKRFTSNSTKKIESLEADLQASEDILKDNNLDEEEAKLRVSILQQQTNKKRNDIKEKEIKLSEYEKIKKRIIQQQELLLKINSLKEKIDIEEVSLDSKNAKYKHDMLNIQSYEKQLEGLNKKKAEQDKLSEYSVDISKKINDIEVEIAKLSSEILEKQKENKKFKDKLANISNVEKCEHCGQKITEACTQAFKDNIDRIVKEALPLISKKKLLESEKEKLNEELENLLSKIDSSIQKSIQAYTVQINNKPFIEKSILDYRSNHKRLIESYKEAIEELDYQVKQIAEEKLVYNKETVSILKNEISAVESEIGNLVDESAEIEAKLKVCSITRKRIKEINSNLTIAKIEHEKNLQALNVFDTQGFRNLLIQKLSPFIHSKIREYMLEVNKSDHEILLTFEDKFDTKFLVDGVERDISLFSGGESRLFSIIFNLVLSDIILKNGKLFEFRIFDEVVDDLDQENTILCLELLRKLAVRNNEQIYVITHSQFAKDVLSANLSGKITVIKQNNKSVVKN